MNKREFNNLSKYDILYCNGMTHNFKGLRVKVLSSENDIENGQIVTVYGDDDRFPIFSNRSWTMSYKALSKNHIDAIPIIDSVAYNF